ncbi:MAG: ABC transporter permease subunit [Verrucomicrobiota bacterium]
MNALWIIALNTIREASRQRLVLALSVSSVAVVSGSLLFQQLDFGKDELKFIVDFGFGSMTFLGAILSIFATAQLYFSELDQRTVHTLLARPISRSSFVLGKALGAFVVVCSFLALTATTLLAVMLYRSSQLNLASGSWIGFDVIVFSILQGFRSAVLISLVMFIGSYARSQLLTVVVSLFLWVVFQIQYIANSAWDEAASKTTRFASWVLECCVPNFEKFNVGDQLVFREPGLLRLGGLFELGVYAAAFTALYLTCAVWSFNRREF